MKELEMIIADGEKEIEMLMTKVNVLEKTLETIHEIYEKKIEKAVKAERIRSKEKYLPWKHFKPFYPGD